ncbi:glycosyltransferase [Pseudomonas mosselii]|uniref:glycosyltransferase n=1 Tax=Pseudomonas mosselii TaxID=78327 RepID=UPI001E4B7EAB|nr:glycosyltransferase [Pseudomonas mosselii]MCL8300376.1 glycosyltransferase [Pseudomonas mosselii]MCL8341217.1 glycosyltransferase [Pseudomonas mosselii]WJR26110.1 glycosyltransferase [Pseudomonas mosselii]
MAWIETKTGLTGEARQKIAAQLWEASQTGGRAAVLITGVSGVGKSDRLVRPLIDRSCEQGRTALRIIVPQSPLSIDAELCALLINELRDMGQDDLAQACEKLVGFSSVAKTVLRQGALIVIDEFQRLLEPISTLPIPAWATSFSKLATRPVDGGCLWLVSNREVAPEWTEPFYTVNLPPPNNDSDQIAIILDALGSEDADARFPSARRVEIARRLGANPRALRFLGILLRTHALEDLMGPAQPTPEEPPDQALVSKLEQQMVARAAEGLPARSLELLKLLTVLPDPASLSLVEAIAAMPRAETLQHAAALQSRYLLDARGSRYAVHPVAREVIGPQLRSDDQNWKKANQRAGQWHADALKVSVNRSPRDADLTLGLSGVRYHFLNVDARIELATALQHVRAHIKTRFGWNAANPTSNTERDSAIALLSVFLESPGDACIEFTYAKMLFERDLPGDLERALPHAQRATVGQDFAHPWVLWIKLVGEVEGLKAAVAAAQHSATAVLPTKNLHSVYQFLGACLDHLGQPEDAITAVLDGAERSSGSEERLVQQAIAFAAPLPDSRLLEQVRDWIKARESKYRPQLAVAEVILLEQQGCWREAAALAAQLRASIPNYLHLCLHEAISELGADNPDGALSALNRFPIPIREVLRDGAQWLLSLIAVQRSDAVQAARHLGIYLGHSQTPNTLTALKSALLREWDMRVSTIGEGNPALMAPVLPSAVTGLKTDVRRPQFGPPVLPQHSSAHSDIAGVSPRLSVLAIATEWQSGRGGLSTLNRNLCLAFARHGATVICVVEPGSGTAHEEGGVQVVVARNTPGMDPHDALGRLPELPADFTPDLIIGHGRVTGPAAKVLAEDHFHSARRLHFVHMAPDEIEWLKPGRQDDAAMRAEERTRTEVDLARGASQVVTIGPRLHGRYLRDLQAEGLSHPLRLDPGFDSDSPQDRHPPDGRPWAVLTMGRMEDAELKGLDIAARAMGRVAADKRVSEALELIVRGVPEGSGEATREKVRDWASTPSLSVLVRPYTIEAARLDADLRRSCLVLMPSRTEGFGLVGLEAILAGTPVLVSEKSGLGELLQEALTKEAAVRHVVPVTGDVDIDTDVWSRAVEAILLDREAAFRRAIELRTNLAKQRTWTVAISALVAELER